MTYVDLRFIKMNLENSFRMKKVMVYRPFQRTSGIRIYPRSKLFLRCFKLPEISEFLISNPLLLQRGNGDTTPMNLFDPGLWDLAVLVSNCASQNTYFEFVIICYFVILNRKKKRPSNSSFYLQNKVPLEVWVPRH